MVRLCAIVAAASGERASYVFRRMPLSLVFHYEAVFYLKLGYSLRWKNRARRGDSLEELLFVE